MIKNQPKMHFVSKGWGWERWVVNKDLYCGKFLFFAKGKRSSLHYHKNKDETFYVHSGKLLIYYSDDLNKLKTIDSQGLLKGELTSLHYEAFCDTVILEPGDNFYLPPGRVHQVVALTDTELFEFSTKHEDSDSYRLIKGD